MATLNLSHITNLLSESAGREFMAGIRRQKSTLRYFAERYASHRPRAVLEAELEV